MIKNKFLTVLFAFVPGASQMYQNYMKRGLSLISVFMAGIFAACIFPLFGLVLPVIYMYNFFDALNLSQAIRDGAAPGDDYMMHLGMLEDSGLKKLLKNNSLVGWGLVALGVVGLYHSVLLPHIRSLYWYLIPEYGEPGPVLELVMGLVNDLPGLVLCIALIVLGVHLVRGPRAARRARPREMPPVPGEEDEI